MSDENTQIAPLILLGIEELAKDVAITELPIVIKYTQGRISYWEQQGKEIHFVRIALLNAELKAFETILADLQA
jgi:hypothetical protein